MHTEDAVQSFIRNRQALDRRPRTIDWYEFQLFRFARHYPRLPRKADDIEAYLASGFNSPATKHAAFRALKAFYHWASQRHHFNNPFNEIGVIKQPKLVMPTLEPEDMFHLLNAVDNDRDRALVTLFLDTGARVSEITSLRRECIFHNSIKVDGKTGERLIPISEETRQLLITIPRHISGTPYVFYNDDGEPLSRYCVYRIIRRLMEKIAISGPKKGPHRLRHSFGKDYLVNGGDVRSLQQLMGHANISTTEQYASLNLEDLTNKHHQFTPLRAAHAKAQQVLFDADALIEEAETILRGRKET